VEASVGRRFRMNIGLWIVTAAILASSFKSEDGPGELKAKSAELVGMKLKDLPSNYRRGYEVEMRPVFTVGFWKREGKLVTVLYASPKKRAKRDSAVVAV
jgi:hypothetical protein